MPNSMDMPLSDEDRPVSKQVDLVIYKGGKRLVIGKAILDPDGKITAQIARDVRKDVQDIFRDGIGDVSINPGVTIVNDPPFSPFNTVSTVVP